MNEIEPHRRQSQPDFAIICEDDDVEFVESELFGPTLYHLRPKKPIFETGTKNWSVHRDGAEAWDGGLTSSELKSPNVPISSNFGEFVKKEIDYRSQEFSQESKNPGLSVGAKEIGLVMTTFFASMLTLSAIFQDLLISPIIGWSGIIFGLGFFAMAKMKSDLS